MVLFSGVFVYVPHSAIDSSHHEPFGVLHRNGAETTPSSSSVPVWVWRAPIIITVKLGDIILFPA